MPIVQIKPLSVNEAYNGRRTRSKKYNLYIDSVSICLPPLKIPDGDLKLSLEVGFSNSGSDLDNAIKPFQDILQKKYGFNDNRVFEIHAIKKKMKKGREYIRFEIGEANVN